MENVLQTLDPKLCIICGKHFEKGKKKDPYVQNPTVEGLQRILTLAQQRDDDVRKTLAPYTDDILSSKIKVSYHVSCRANYCSNTKISEQQQVSNVESESTSAPRRLSRADTTSFKIRRDCFICGKASSRPEPLTAISTGTGASTRDKVLRAASERLDEEVHLLILSCPDLFAYDAKYHKMCLAHYISERNIAFTSDTACSVASVLYLPFIRESPSELSTIYTSMIRLVQLAAELGQHHILVTADLAIYSKAQQILWSKPLPLQGKITMRLGGMHITMAYLASIGKLYGDGGLFDILTESDVYAEGTARQLLQGKQLARGVRSIKLASEALFRLFWQSMQSWLEKQGLCAMTEAHEQILRDVQHAFHGNDKATAQQLISEVETELPEIQKIIQMFINEGVKQSATFGYWLMFLNGADLLLRILRSEREADFQLHLNCMCEVMPWLRAAGRTNYGKYMPVYVAEMKALEHEQPEAYTFMQQGGFVVRRSEHRSFNCVATDQALEQTINQEGKSQGGVVGFTLRKGALTRWLMTRHVTTVYVDAMKELCDTDDQSPKAHKEHGASRMDRDERHIQKIMEAVEQRQNPFDLEKISKMAARSDAAATPGPKNGVFMSVSLVSSSSNCLTLLKNQKTNTRKHIYDRQSLLDIDNVYKHQLSPATTEKLQGLCLLLKPDPETAASPTDATRTKRRRRRCERGQKRGKRGGIRARLRANPTSPAIPSLMLSNVRSLENKLDLIKLSRSTQHETRDCCVFVFTETWLNDNIPDSAIQLHGLTCCRADRDSSLSGKTRGGGLCVYINKEWCNNAAVLSKHCSSLVEFMVVKCRPFYLPREFTAIVIVAVYIPPCANAKDALRELYSAISEQQTNNPDGFFIIAGDFNHANLKTVLPKFYQHVNFATRGNNTLDSVYTTVKHAYKAEPRPHLGYSDHISVMLIPAYRPLLKLAKPVQKQITVWPDNATSALQDCFQDTDWNMFKEAATYNNHTDLQEYTETVTAYIKYCIDDVTVTKTITTRANRKPWMTAEVRGLLKTRDEAFRSGDKAALKTARANLSRGIKNAKRLYGNKINNQFTNSRDTRSLWQGIQTITDYKPPPQACDDDTSLPDALNHFYSRFEMQNNTSAQKLPTPPNDQALCLSPADVRKTLSRINPRKAAGPDNIPGRVLKDCAEQLTDVLTDIFNISLSQAVIPTCLKSTTIIPVPKKSPVSCLNDYRPIALTPIIMKCFERLVMHNIKTSLPNTLDPLQFAYRPNRSTDDAISSTLHLALTHLENKDSYVRMLFIDFSSAFNTIIPQQLINKLSLLGLNNSLCNWILDFLTGRPQSVRVGHNTSSTTTLSTGAPQGCVLSPLLFTLLTHDCTAKFSSNHIIKFADDTSVVGLISNNDETHYREEVAQLAEWCGANNLSLNVEKTKEVVMDFRRNSVDHPPLTIDTSTVERVSSTKFLGVHITEDLTWTTNTKSISKKAQQRLNFLRRLKRASLPPPILTTFYRGTIESVLTSCITVWYGNCCAADRKTLQRTVNTAAKIIGAPLPSILDIFLTRCSSKAKSIVEDPTHPSHSLFQLLPSGRRYRSIRARSARLLNSFFPQAVRALNSHHTAPL